MNDIFNHIGESCWDCECVFEEGDSAYPEYSHFQDKLRFLCPKCHSKSMSLYRSVINWIKYKFHIHEWKFIESKLTPEYYVFQCVICKAHKKEKL